MSYENPRINLHDTIATAISKMSDGNPGALSVLAQLAHDGNRIDPDAVLGGGLSFILDLDSLDIYGSEIWVLYKDICGSNLAKLCAVLRGWQLGFIPESEVRTAVRVPLLGMTINIDEIVRRVRERLPNFLDPATLEGPPPEAGGDEEKLPCP